MAEQSLVSAVAANRPARIDPNEFKPKSGGNLDVVTEPFRPSSKEKQESSLNKITNFRPVNLKSLSSGIQESGDARKQTTAIRSAEQKLVTDKVQSIREQNPFSNIVEKQVGRSLNITA